MSKELKPCPFCNHPATLYVRGNKYVVRCTSCCARGPKNLDMDETTRLWNLRSASRSSLDRDKEIAHTMASDPIKFVQSWKIKPGVYGEPCYPQGVKNQIDDAKDRNAAKSTAQQVLDFFTSRNPCRVVVLCRTMSQLAATWGDLRNETVRMHGRQRAELYQQPFKFRKFIGDGNELCQISYLVGMTLTGDERLMGHHVPDQGDGIPRTMCVIDEADGITDEQMERLHSWANVILTNGATDGDEDKDDGCEPTIIAGR